MDRSFQNKKTVTIVTALLPYDPLVDKPLIILTAINNVVDVNGIVFDLIDHHVALLKQEKPILVCRNKISPEPRTTVWQGGQGLSGLFKIRDQLLRSAPAHFSQKAGMGDKHPSPRGWRRFPASTTRIRPS